MSEYKSIIAAMDCAPEAPDFDRAAFLSYVQTCNDNGADGIWFRDCSETDEGHESAIGILRETAGKADIPIFAGGRVKRLEDVKKYLYAGAEAVFLDGGDEEHIDLIKEAANRFGPEKTLVLISDEQHAGRAEEFRQLGARGLILDSVSAKEIAAEEPLSIYSIQAESKAPQLADLLKDQNTAGVILTEKLTGDGAFMELKQALSGLGCEMNLLKSSVEWKDFKTNEQGLVPVIVQDFKTSEVLMLAYMNEQAFLDTLRSGRMHYYSRSRQTQWMKGETSGHFQYVKSLKLDCDNDTLLAAVHQVGVACHTGARSCFFQTLAEKPYKETNPLKVFEDVFSVIQDRKIHPKEGSYTNYLFDKGIDKILKKVGEEATEIVIAAKNPDPEEIKYEIADFLYHVMVLMAERGVTWEEITEELANR